MLRRPNFLLVITDQQSGNPYWPEGWERENLPATTWLKDHGIHFPRAYTNSCTCSPARVTMLTGLYPAQHGVTEVLEFDNIQRFVNDLTGDTAGDPDAPPPTTQQVTSAVAMNAKERRQRALTSDVQNLAKVLRTAGYDVIFKGKWHLTKPVQWVPELGQKYWTEADVEQLADRFGFDGWTMPDAGDNMAVENMGGGTIRNDQRFISGHGQAAKYPNLTPEALDPHSVLHFLKNYDGEKPFCLIVSLVNPHDVLAYPGNAGGSTGAPLYEQAGYKLENFADLPIDRPPTWNEDLSTKPRAQSEFLALSQAGNGPIGPDDEELQKNYCRFYAYLCSLVDKQILEVLHALRESKHGEDTVILRFADHGDMAMSHGLQRQKMFNMYEETVNIPLVMACPSRFPGGRVSNALVSLIDLLPTIANLAGVPDLHRWTFKGRDLTPILADPTIEVQDYLHFTYEDLYFFAPSANHIRAIIEKRFKYAVYYDIYTNAPFEYEMYDLDVPRDQREVVNLAHPATPVTPEIAAERERLHQKLIHVMTVLGTTPHDVVWPKHWGDQPGR